MSGAIAERAKFEAYICYSFFMAAWVYPVCRTPALCVPGSHPLELTTGWSAGYRLLPLVNQPC